MTHLGRRKPAEGPVVPRASARGRPARVSLLLQGMTPIDRNRIICRIWNQKSAEYDAVCSTVGAIAARMTEGPGFRSMQEDLFRAAVLQISARLAVEDVTVPTGDVLGWLRREARAVAMDLTSAPAA